MVTFKGAPTAGMRRHVLALTLVMVIGSVLGGGALVLLGHDSVRGALAQTAVGNGFAYLVMLLYVRRTGHL